jgi:hypothetical protein
MSEKNRVQSEELPPFVHRRYRTQEQEEKNLGSVQVQTMCEYYSQQFWKARQRTNSNLL